MRLFLQHIGALLISALILSCAGTVTLHGQLINGSFESGLDGWTAPASVGVSGPPGQVAVGVDGSRAATLGIFDLSGATLAQTANVIAGTNYVLSFATAANGAVGRPGVVHVVVEGGGQMLTSANYTNLAIQDLSGTNGFIRRNLAFVTPAAVTQVTVRFEDASANGGFQVDPTVDDVQLLLSGAGAATVISGFNVASTDTAGNINFDSFWNTRGGDIVVNCFMIGSLNLNGPFLNGPTDGSASLSVPLAPGKHDFSIFAPGGTLHLTHSFNLFFNGDTATPGISIYAPTQLSASPPFPSFLPNGAVTRTLSHTPVAGANSTRFSDGVNVLTLTDWHWIAPSVLSLDRTATGPGNWGSVGADGFVDWVGQFTLDVSPVTPSLGAVPRIFSFSPASGPVGTTVTITGTNFSSITGSNTVYFGAVRATVMSASANSLSVTVPSGATYAPITVTVGGLTGFARAPFAVTFPSSQTLNSSSFGPRVDFVSGNIVNYAALGDFDGDGKSDAVAVNSGSDTISVFRNISTVGSFVSNSFAPRVDLPVGANPYTVAIGDLDGDGRLDLAVANGVAGTVSVYRNISASGSLNAGSFSARVDFVVGSVPFGMAIGDLDADGRPDLVVVNSGSGSVSVLRNTSTVGSLTPGSFAPKVDFTVGPSPQIAAIADLDGDGKPDLAVGNFGGNTLSVLRNTSTVGSLTASSFAPRVDFTTGDGPASIALGDLDGDGKPDIATANYRNGTISVLRNTSMPGSISPSSFAANVDFAAGGQPYSIAMGDLDGDGRPDLAMANPRSNVASVYRNTGTTGSITTGSFAPRVDFATTNPNGIAIGDLDGDGRPDLLIANYLGDTLSVLRNQIPQSAPNIPTQPASQSAFVGSNVTFSVAATGPGLTYQWRFNGHPIDGRTNATLLLANVQRTNGGAYSVTVSNSFGSVTSSNAVLTLLNRPPAAFSLSITLDEDTAAAITLTAADPDNDPLHYLFALPDHGSLMGTPPNVIYIPAPDYHGPDSLMFLVSDGFLFSTAATVNITVRPVNDPPIAQAQSVSVNEDSSAAITLTASDVDGDPLTFTVTPPAHGTVSGTAPNLTYHPAPDYHGSDTFTFKANDGQADSAVATVSITVVSVNDAPVARAVVSPLLVLSPGQTNQLILSLNGSNAAVVLDASLSTDADLEPLQFLWLADVAPMPFANGVRTTNALPVGPHAITLVAYDNTDHGMTLIQFEILTAGQAVAQLTAQVEDSNLSRKNKRPLLGKLKASQRALADGKTQHGLRELEDFQDKVRAQIAPTDPALASELTHAAQNILDAFPAH